MPKSKDAFTHTVKQSVYINVLIELLRQGVETATAVMNAKHAAKNTPSK